MGIITTTSFAFSALVLVVSVTTEFRPGGRLVVAL